MTEGLRACIWVVPDAAWMDQLGDGLSDEAKASFDLLTDQDDVSSVCVGVVRCVYA